MKTEFVTIQKDVVSEKKTELTHCLQWGLNSWHETAPNIEYVKIVYLGDFKIGEEVKSIFACYQYATSNGMHLWAGIKGSEFK